MRELRTWLGPEAQLLVLAARRDASPTNMRALIGPKFDWRLLEAMAWRQSATNVLVGRLRTLGIAVPPAVLERLDTGSMVAEFRLRCLEQALLEATGILSGAGVDVVLLKGAALALTVYPSFVDRGMQDLDLLVRPEDAARASQALERAGWLPAYPRTMDPFFRQHHHAVPLEAPRLANARVELHTGLFRGDGPFAFTPDDIRRDAVPVTVGGQTVRLPSNAHMLLHLCLHFVWSHGLARGMLRTAQDLDVLWRRTPGFDASFARVASDARAATCCYWTLRYAQRLLDVPVPADLLAALRPPGAEWLLDLLERHFATVAGLTPVTCPSVQVDRGMWSLAVLPGWSGLGAKRPWLAGEDWLAVAPRATGDHPPYGFWKGKLLALSAFGRYAALLLR